MKKLLLTILISFAFTGVAHAQTSFVPNLVPLSDSTYRLGSTSPLRAFLQVIADSFYDTDASDGCATWVSNILTSTGVACGSGSGGTATDTAWQIIPAGVRLSTSSNQVVIGANSTTTNSKLEVTGATTLKGITTVWDYLTSGYFTATNTDATSTFPNASITLLNLNGSIVNAFGTTLSLTAGTLDTVLGNDVDLASAEVTGILPVSKGGIGRDEGTMGGTVAAFASAEAGLIFWNEANQTFINNSALTFNEGIGAGTLIAQDTIRVDTDEPTMANCSVVSTDADHGLVCSGTTYLTAVNGTYPIEVTGGNTISLAFGTTTANNWALLQTLTNASSTVFSSLNGIFVGRTSTTTILGDGATSTIPNATTTNLAISRSFTLFGDTFTTDNALCIGITGSADLCDGNDATGAGGDFPFTATTQWGQAQSATGTSLWLQSSPISLVASGTSRLSTTTMTANQIQMGVYPYPIGAYPQGTNFYQILDKGGTAADATIVFRDQGNARAEVGILNDNQFQIKTITGNYGSEVFSTRLNIENDTGRVGIGTEAPSSLLDVASTSPSARVDLRVTNQSTSGTDGTSLQLVANNDGHVWYLGTDAGLNGGNNLFLNRGNFGAGLFMDSAERIGIWTTSPSAGNVFDVANAFVVSSTTGNVGVGSSTPWAEFSVAKSTHNSNDPIMFISTSSNPSGYLFGVFATSSTLQAINDTRDSGARVVIGGTSFYGDTPMDQFTVDGRISTGEWLSNTCYSTVGTISTDTGGSGSCTAWSFSEDVAGSFGSGDGGGYPVLTQTAGPGTAGDGAGIFYGGLGAAVFYRFNLGSSTPIWESITRINNVQNSTGTTRYIIGFTNTGITGSSFEIEPTAGCYFMASTTQNNWRAICRTSVSAVTDLDTGVASSSVVTGSGAHRTMRIETGTSTVKFYIGTTTTNTLPLVASITTNIPNNSVQLYGGAHIAIGPAGLVKTMEHFYIKISHRFGPYIR